MRLEAAHLAGRSRIALRRLAANDPAHCRIMTQAFGVVHVFVSGEPTEYRLPQHPDQVMAAVLAGPRVREQLTRHRCQPERVVEFMPGVYECLEAERIKYAIRLPANQVLQNRIGYLLTRPVGRPPNEVRYYANFTYRAASWTKPRRVIAKVEWHPGELYPRVGFIVTNMSRPAERVVAFYNKRGTCEQWIKEGKGAIKWTRLSCRTFAANAVRLQLHALAYNLGNFLRTLATPEPIKDWSLTTLKDNLIKIGAKVVSHGRYIIFQMAEVAIARQMFQEILRLIAELRPQPPPAPA